VQKWPAVEHEKDGKKQDEDPPVNPQRRDGPKEQQRNEQQKEEQRREKQQRKEQRSEELQREELQKKGLQKENNSLFTLK